MATLLSIVFLTLVLSTHHAVGGRGRISRAGNMREELRNIALRRSPQEMLCSRYEGGVEKYCPKKESSPGSASSVNPSLIDFLATGLDNCPITNWNCPDDTIKTLTNVDSWEDCGRACDTYYGCKWWTFTYENKLPRCYLKSSCKDGRIQVGFTSGPKGCPPNLRSRSPAVRGICQSCGSCSCCLGACIFGACIPACIGNARSKSSVQEACLFEANTLSMGDCSGSCPVGGEASCQTCLAATGSKKCQQTKSFGCFTCVLAVGKALYDCIGQFEKPLDILNCIKGAIPDCASCACELACKVFPAICPLC
eukprot:GFUD01013622.1.p1 GENE.GFUD01013622.1~~GFUD01013622.1.p1  ORF type:complete len:309 (-),score=17.12 GFUD01013622.1:236-1162(-)